jgi:spore maturation protein CgeB
MFAVAFVVARACAGRLHRAQRGATTSAMSRPIDHVALVTRYRPGAWSLSIQRGFEAGGRRCTLIPYENWYPVVHRPGVRGTGLLNQLVRAAVRPAAEVRLLHAISQLRPDLLFFLKADDLHRAVYPLARKAGARALAAYHPDDPFNTGRLLPGITGPSHPRAIAQARLVDANVTWSPGIKTRLEAAGCAHVTYLPFAADAELHPRVELSDEDRATYGADVSFVGNWDSERERWLAEVAPLCEARGLRLAIWGSAYWRTHCRTEAVTRAWRGRELTAAEMAKVAGASRVNLNILRQQNIGGSNMRTFEIPCAGGFMLHQRTPMLAEWLPPAVACDDFGSAAELVEKALFYRNDDDAWSRIREEGFARARRWTYKEWTDGVIDAAMAATASGR